MAMAGFKVFRGSKHVDTVFYPSKDTPEKVRESLVRRGEFPSTIKVRRERKPNGYGVSGTAKTKRMKAVRNPKRKLWSAKVTRKVKRHTPPGLFEQSAEKIAKGLKRESKDYAEAMRKLTFYMNRAGSNLKPRDTGRLNNAKVKLAHLYGRNPPAGARKKRRKAKRK